MGQISRRTFTRRLAAVPFLHFLAAQGRSAQMETPPAIPEKVAGYLPAPEERAAMVRFLTKQEELLAPLRQHALPNDLPPASVFHPVHGTGSFDTVVPRHRTGRRPGESESPEQQKEPEGSGHD